MSILLYIKFELYDMEENKNNELLKEAIELIKETFNHVNIYAMDDVDLWIDLEYDAISIIRQYVGGETEEENDRLFEEFVTK